MADAPLRTFRDDALERRLLDDGFVVTPVLPPQVVADLSAAYRELAPADDRGLVIDFVRPDRTFMARVRELLEPVWEDVFPQLFAGHRAGFVTFVTKHRGHESEMFLHEDRTFVDERRVRAGTLWVPLVDVGPGLDNGGLELVPGSHRLFHAFSGSNTPDLIRPYESFLRERLVRVPVPAGSAVYYDTRTLHASPPNLTDVPRMAVATAVVPDGEQLVHVVATGRRRRRMFAVDDEFFQDHHPREVERAMPARFELLEEWDEDEVLEPETLARTFGVDPPSPSTVVPPDLLGVVTPGSVPRRRGGTRRVDDLVVDPASIDPSATVARTGLQATQGIAGVVDDPEIPDRRLLVLLPTARASVRGDAEGLARRDLTVVEAPPVGAGCAVDGRGTALDVGDELSVDAASDVLFWNDGPGVLALAVSTTAPAAATPTPTGGTAAGRRLAGGAVAAAMVAVVGVFSSRRRRGRGRPRRRRTQRPARAAGR